MAFRVSDLVGWASGVNKDWLWESQQSERSFDGSEHLSVRCEDWCWKQVCLDAFWNALLVCIVDVDSASTLHVSYRQAEPSQECTSLRKCDSYILEHGTPAPHASRLSQSPKRQASDSRLGAQSFFK